MVEDLEDLWAEGFVINSTLCSSVKDGLLSVSTGQCNILKMLRIGQS